MAYPPLENLLPKTGGSIYKLVRLAAQRAAELADGKPKLVELHAIEKVATVALEEIKAGKVVLKDFADQFKPTKPSVRKESAEEVQVSAG
ncbi:MAG: DNA-directed RNA polymerase subunit omega [Candidatus Omnitrophica bacterium]|nr:DNA-directed RNA polymerase subunit omega [Candidatus Omnitrophota bacterium]